jgi:hypothetical protein
VLGKVSESGEGVSVDGSSAVPLRGTSNGLLGKLFGIVIWPGREPNEDMAGEKTTTATQLAPGAIV